MDISGFIAAAESLSENSLDELAGFYAQDACFTDPFQTVKGQAAIRQVYADMFAHLHQPRFRSVHLMGAADPANHEAVIGWEFEFALGPGKPRQRIPGCSRLRFDTQGKIREHLDFWDASRLMQSFPLIGPVIGWIRRKIGHPARP